MAVVHDYLTQRGGAERVVLAMMRAFPDARLVTTTYAPESTFPTFASYDIQTSWLQRLPALRNDPRRALPLLAPTVSRMSLPDVDVVLCSSSGWAHGIQTTAPKIVYCYNPARWLYQHKDYIAGHPHPVRAVRAVLSRPLRAWDARAASTATRYLTSSTVVRARIRAAYGVDAEVVPPPVGLDPDGPQVQPAGLEPGFFLVVGRARGYKNTTVVCEAFAQLPDERLVVVGGLPEGRDWPSNLRGMTAVTDSELRWLYAHSHAVVAASHEDFGLTPLEGNSLGRPSLCLRAGGFLDTLAEGVSGLWIEDLTPAAVVEAVRRSLTREWDSAAITRHADTYSEAVFAESLHRHVDDVLSARRGAAPAA